MSKKPISDDERHERRKRAIANRTNRALAAIGVDIANVPANDRDALAQADRNVRRLNDIGEQMRRGGSPTDPTLGRRAHAGAAPRVIDMGPTDAKAHHFEWVLDAIRERLTTRQYEAAERLRNCHLNMQPSSAVASLSGAGGSSDPTGRLPMTETQELARRQFEWIMARIPTVELRQAIENFVLERSIYSDGKQAMSLEDYGTRVCKFGRDRNRAAAIRDVVQACAMLDHLWHSRETERKEQCARTDQLMRSDVGRRAGVEGWICALWDWCFTNKRLPKNEKEIGVIRENHDAKARLLRRTPQLVIERWYQRRDRLTAFAFRHADERVRMAS